MSSFVKSQLFYDLLQDSAYDLICPFPFCYKLYLSIYSPGKSFHIKNLFLFNVFILNSDFNYLLYQREQTRNPGRQPNHGYPTISQCPQHYS